MPPYFHYLDTQKVGNGTVADIATRAFANLLTAAGKKSNVCVVVSDLAATYDTCTRLINRALEDARQELGRQERNITPVDLASNDESRIARSNLRPTGQTLRFGNVRQPVADFSNSARRFAIVRVDVLPGNVRNRCAIAVRLAIENQTSLVAMGSAPEELAPKI